MRTSREPEIVVVRDDLERLGGFLSATNPSSVAEYLGWELARARVVEAPPEGKPVVRLNSQVRFKDSANAAARDVTLVVPSEADIDAGRLSVLTPVGAALLGLSVGQEITFTLPNGRERSLRVIAIGDQQIGQA